jgi:CcmD family protein
VTAEEKYVAAAYAVVFAFLLVYVVIIAAKVGRLERELTELVERAAELAKETGDV